MTERMPGTVSEVSATLVANKMRRGWVWPMSPASPRPASRQIFGNWVVLPEQVSPQTMMTWCCNRASRISSLRSETGRVSGYSMTGRLVTRAWRAATDSAMRACRSYSAVVMSLPALASAWSRSRSRRRRCWSLRRVWGRRVSCGLKLGVMRDRAWDCVGAQFYPLLDGLPCEPSVCLATPIGLSARSFPRIPQIASEPRSSRPNSCSRSSPPAP